MSPSSVRTSLPEPASSIMTSSTRRREFSKAAKGVSLGLEDEADFGSDEDTLDTVGEIVEATTPVWYPGMPETVSTDRSSSKWKSKADKKASKSQRSGTASPAKSGSSSGKSLLSRKGTDRRGLGDARVIPLNDLMADTQSIRSNSQASASLLSLKKEGNRSKVFGKFFRKKDASDTLSISSALRFSDSVESFGSARLNDVSSHPSNFVSSAPMPPSHAPAPRKGLSPSVSGHFKTSAASSPSFESSEARSARTTTPPTLAQSQGSNLLDVPTGPESAYSDTFKRTVERLDDHPTSYPTVATRAKVTSQVTTDGENPSRPEHDSRHLSAVSDNTALSHPSLTTDSLGEPCSPDTAGSIDLAGCLVPPFPTSEPSLETTTILSTTVMRRVPAAQIQADKWSKPLRTSQASSTSSSSFRRPIWQTHQLVLTSFRIADGTPSSSPRLGKTSGLTRHSSTIAHLHLFAFNPPPRASPPATGSASLRRGAPSMEGAGKVEVDRRAIGAHTVAGVWEGDEGPDSTHGRKWVLKVRFNGEVEEWLCDMPSGDMLFEWVRQIKALVAVIKSEKGPGRSGSISHHSGTEDLAMHVEKAELEFRMRQAQNTRREHLSPQSRSATACSLAEMEAAGYVQGGPPTLGPMVDPMGRSTSDEGHRRDQAAHGLGINTSGASSSVRHRNQMTARSALPPPLPAPSYAPPKPPVVLPRKSSLSPSIEPVLESKGEATQLSEGWVGQFAFEAPSPPSSPPSVPETPADSPHLADIRIAQPSSVDNFFPGPVPLSNSSQEPEKLNTGLSSSVAGMKIEDGEGGSKLISPGPASIKSACGDDSASISSKTSSARAARRAKKAVPAMDLMAELNSRPEMNYDRLIAETEPIDEDRPRKIRFQ